MRTTTFVPHYFRITVTHQISHSYRAAFSAVALFFVIGFPLLFIVDLPLGRKNAELFSAAYFGATMYASPSSSSLLARSNSSTIGLSETTGDSNNPLQQLHMSTSTANDEEKLLQE